MIRKVLIRLLNLIPVLIGISFLSFLLMRLSPGDFLSQMSLNPQVSPEIIAKLRSLYGLDQPLPVQYFRWVEALLRGEFGYSFSYHVKVTDLILSRVPNTLLLAVSSVILSWGLAIPLAIRGAMFPNGFLDRTLTGMSYLSIAIPSFFLAILGVLLAGETGWFPIGGASSPGVSEGSWWPVFLDRLHHLILPALTLALGSIGVLYRLMKSSVMEVMGKPWMTAARARGLSPALLRRRYLFRNAINPLITIFGFELGGLLSGAAFTEMVYGWPGMGRLMLHAVMSQDLYLVMGGIMTGAVMLLSGNMIADTFLWFLDPRVREEE